MMFQLEPLEDGVREEYIKKLLSSLHDRIKNGRRYNKGRIELSTSAQGILIPASESAEPKNTILGTLLTDEPEGLLTLNDELTQSLEALPEDQRPTPKMIEDIFNYEGVFKDKEIAYWLSKLIERNTCVYCNRQYVFTIEAVAKDEDEEHLEQQQEYIEYEEKEEVKDKNTVKLARPVFDHWFPKSLYPLLSLSLHNLIPSCAICNSSIKGSMSMNLNKYIHPYIKYPTEAKFTFRATPSVDGQGKWAVKIERKVDSKIDNTIKAFALEEIYNMHSELEVKDIMDFHEAYPEGYINDLLDTLLNKNNLNLTVNDVYRILFGTEFSEDKFLDRPFSKLKKDLLRQIGVVEE